MGGGLTVGGQRDSGRQLLPRRLELGDPAHAITAVAMSGGANPCRAAGTATDSGLVATAAPFAPGVGHVRHAATTPTAARSASATRLV